MYVSSDYDVLGRCVQECAFMAAVEVNKRLDAVQVDAIWRHALSFRLELGRDPILSPYDSPRLRWRASWDKDIPSYSLYTPQSPFEILPEQKTKRPTMVKRPREDDAPAEEVSSKRLRPSSVDRLSRLSDELILRVLSYLPISNLVICQR